MYDEPDLFAPIRRDEIGEIVAGFGFLFLWIPAAALLLLEWYILGAAISVMWAASMPFGVWLDWRV